MKTLNIAVAALAALCSSHSIDSSAQATASAYLTDARGAVVKNAFNSCWRTGYWTPALAIAECDPDPVSKQAASTTRKSPSAPAPAPAVPPDRAAPAPTPMPAARPAAAKARKCDASVTLKGDEVFAFNRASLNAAARARLDRDVVSRVRTCARLDAVIIEGHADRLGSQAYDQKLSEKRAQSVKNYLVSRGIDARKIETLGMGKTVPAKFCPKSNSREELIACLAPNRRVIVFFKGPAK